MLLGSCTHRFADVDTSPAANFEALWKIIDEKYCLFEDKTVDWDSVYSAYHQRFDTMKIVKYEDSYRLFDGLEDMLNELEDGHVNLYSPFDISLCSKWYEGYPENFDSEILSKYYLKDYRRANGLNYSRIDCDSIGYVYYGSFSDGFSLTNWLAVLNYFAKCRGIVLDVRNNGGGSMENAYRLAAPFFTKDTVVGYWQHKSGPGHEEFSEYEPMIMNESMGIWRRPVVVLCNRRSYSAANSFVSIMRYADNCLILGGKSGGGGGMPMSYELPNGWMVRFSSVKMYDRDMQSIEGGVRPHLLVNQHSEDKDDLIEEAVNLINSAYKK
jgi:C-terminal processing protease CtpA/Prc